MKKIADYIKEYLSDKSWVDKQELCSQVGYLSGAYSDTVGRTLRKMTEQGKLEKREYESKRGTQYRLSKGLEIETKETIHEMAKRLRQDKETALETNLKLNI